MTNERQYLAASASTAAIAIALLVSSQAFAAALPTKGHFAEGQGVIGKAASSLTVKQSSTTGIINWNSFSVGKKNGVTFDNGSGATLNRVTGSNLSTIAGSLHATGSVYLLNSQGVIVSGTGHIVTGGNFIASSGNISNSAFGTDDQRLRSPNAAVINHGTITAGGHAALVGSIVANTGYIDAASVVMRGRNSVDAGGTVQATANAQGDGRILVISKSGETKVTGDLVARGANGAGGRIETSGYRVAIGGTIDAGKGGDWAIDPVNLTVKAGAAQTIDNSLNAGTNVKLETTKNGASGPGTQTSGAGDISIRSALSWSSKADLTLDAYHSILVSAPISVTGKGGVSLTSNTSNTDGHLLFQGGDLTFAHASSGLTIDGFDYTLVNNISTLSSDIANDPSGNYALANSYNASADGTYSNAPIAAIFQGAFEGLGNTISNLSINAKSQTYVGLFRYVGFNGLVENLNLANVNVAGGGNVGALAGKSEGIFANDTSSGTVDGGTGSYDGGLVGTISHKALVADSSSSATVSARGSEGQIGGLAGNARSGSTIQNSFATGSVTAGKDASVGGLVGADSDVTIEDSYATGSVTDTANGNAGGLVGRIINASIVRSFATGDVSGSDGAWVGGLIGYNEGGSIANAYAMGSAQGGTDANVGGFAGTNTGVIATSYSTGAVSGGSNSFLGGFVGDDKNSGGISNSYWDVKTSGFGTSAGAGNVSHDAGITGRTTHQLTSGLPAGFSSAIWDESATVNGGLPYLIGVTPA
jgi:filamentous hemagglutinin family protein